jgi:shikimate dehydrogenase
VSLAGLITNALELDRESPYAAIIGANPSAGARSPKLWNAALAAYGRPWRMLPMDVTAGNLPALLAELRDDANFIGGAIAVPHKEAAARWLAENPGAGVSETAAKIGAVNAMFRGGAGELLGTNTDGEGALRSLREATGDLAGRRILQLGLGGAGKAVAAYVAGALDDPADLTASVRRPAALQGFADKLGIRLAGWPPGAETMRDVDVVINCTTIGARIEQVVDGEAGELVRHSPLANLDDDGVAVSKRLLAMMPSGGVVFDIIYDPAASLLLTQARELGLRTRNGAGMNLEQAVIAFDYALGDGAEPALTRSAMQAAVSA